MEVQMQERGRSGRRHLRNSPTDRPQLRHIAGLEHARMQLRVGSPEPARHRDLLVRLRSCGALPDRVTRAPGGHGDGSIVPGTGHDELGNRQADPPGDLQRDEFALGGGAVEAMQAQGERPRVDDDPPDGGLGSGHRNDVGGGREADRGQHSARVDALMVGHRPSLAEAVRRAGQKS